MYKATHAVFQDERAIFLVFEHLCEKLERPGYEANTYYSHDMYEATHTMHVYTDTH